MFSSCVFFQSPSLESSEPFDLATLELLGVILWFVGLQTVATTAKLQMTSSSCGKLVWSSITLIFLYRLGMATLFMRSADVPDEWWQSTEVAYYAAFGKGHLSMEWIEGLRSFLYPLPFACVFWLLKLTGCDTAFTVWFSAKVLAALVASGVDVGVYNLALSIETSAESSDGRTEVAYPRRSVARMALLFSLTHFFSSYISVRTQSNVVEALVLLIALQQRTFPRFLLVAGMGGALRITAVVPCMPLALRFVLTATRRHGAKGLLHCASWTVALVAFWVGVVACVDFVFYGRWLCTPYNFVHFNVVKGYSKYFGVHPWHWYWTKALPVMIGPQVLFFALFVTRSAQTLAGPNRARIVDLLSMMVVTSVLYSFLEHKEMRFVYPLVPVAIALSAWAFVRGVCPNRLRPMPGPASALWVGCIVLHVGVLCVVGPVYRCGTVNMMAFVRSRPVIANQLDVFAGCYATPGYSHMHGKVLSLRTIDCTLQVVDGAPKLTERDMFHRNATAFALWAYRGIPSSDRTVQAQLDTVVSGGTWSLPDAVILYSNVAQQLYEPFLQPSGFTQEVSLYHTFSIVEPDEDVTIELWSRR